MRIIKKMFLKLLNWVLGYEDSSQMIAKNNFDRLFDKYKQGKK